VKLSQLHARGDGLTVQRESKFQKAKILGFDFGILGLIFGIMFGRIRVGSLSREIKVIVLVWG
jgi:hypothetical protein